jgi:hypothetical protein
MQLKINRRLASGAAGALLVFGGAGAAVAATQGSGSASPRQAYLDSVAKHLGVSPSALGSAIRAADVERIEAAVASGRITQAQAQQLKERLQRPGAAPLFGPRLGGEHRRAAGLLKVASEYLGVSPATLLAERAGGHSLAQIAAATPGKSAQGLKEALVKAITKRLKDAVSSGRTGTDTEQRIHSAVEKRVEAMLQRTPAAHRLAPRL